MEENTTTSYETYDMIGANGKKKSKKRYMIRGILLAIGLLWILSDAFEGGMIATVKEGYFTNYPNVTVGDAFEDFFEDAKWKAFKAGDDAIVEFTGKCILNYKPVNAKIQFTVEDEKFEITSFIIDGKTFNSLEIGAMISQIMG